MSYYSPIAVEQFHILKAWVLNSRKEKSSTRLPKSISGGYGCEVRLHQQVISALVTCSYWRGENLQSLTCLVATRSYGITLRRECRSRSVLHAHMIASAVIKHVMARS